MPTLKRQPDFEQFLNILWRRKRPDHLPFYEHNATGSFIARRMQNGFERMAPGSPEYWRTFVDFWIGLGFDCIPMEIPLRINLAPPDGAVSHGSEARAVIRSHEDFEAFPWPTLDSPIDFSHFQTVAGLMPEGAKIVGGVCMGPFEWVSEMMGVQGLSLAIYTDPDLVERMFEKIGELIVAADRQLATMDAIGALRQGDDLGFKTATFLPPDTLRQYVFPIYTRMVQAAHEREKPFVLHSCGNLGHVYDDLIDGCGIDAKHSFEDVILPVNEFKKQYRGRVTPLGGLDVDKICRSDERELRAYARKTIEQCFDDGFWALGTGNSLTDYMPVENYLIVLEEGMAAGRA
jgi:uroporphyrinogen decarboxylase